MIFCGTPTYEMSINSSVTIPHCIKNNLVKSKCKWLKLTHYTHFMFIYSGSLHEAACFLQRPFHLRITKVTKHLSKHYYAFEFILSARSLLCQKFCKIWHNNDFLAWFLRLGYNLTISLAVRLQVFSLQPSGHCLFPKFFLEIEKTICGHNTQFMVPLWTQHTN